MKERITPLKSPETDLKETSLTRWFKILASVSISTLPLFALSLAFPFSIFAQNQTQAIKGETNFFQSLIVFLGAGIVLFALGGLGYHLFRKSQIKARLGRDQKRKEDLQRIKEGLSAFYKMRGRYPDRNRGEYQEVLDSLNPPAIDPKDGSMVDQKTNVYGYYYDNLPPGADNSSFKNLNYYRLWSYPENQADPEASSVGGQLKAYLLFSPTYPPIGTDANQGLNDIKQIDSQAETEKKAEVETEKSQMGELVSGKVGALSRGEKVLIFSLLGIFSLILVSLIVLDVLVLLNIL